MNSLTKLLKKLNHAELKVLAAEHGLSTAGTKAQLIRRILNKKTTQTGGAKRSGAAADSLECRECALCKPFILPENLRQQGTAELKVMFTTIANIMAKKCSANCPPCLAKCRTPECIKSSTVIDNMAGLANNAKKILTILLERDQIDQETFNQTNIYMDYMVKMGERYKQKLMDEFVEL